jgi:uncharacterized protein (UPF0332 family)
LKHSKEDLINYRIERAYESLDEAKILANSNHWNTAVNRLYYACFYRVNALFSRFDIIATTHAGIKAEFNKSFIKSGIFDKSVGKLYSDLFNKRQEGDYQDFYTFEKEEIEPLIDAAEKVIQVIEKHLKSH